MSHGPVHAPQEVAICFGGSLLRGNRTQKVDSSSYQAFASPSYPPLAKLGVNVDWDESYLLQAWSLWLTHWQDACCDP